MQSEDAVGIEILADVLGQIPGRLPGLAQGALSDRDIAEQFDMDESPPPRRIDLAVADVPPDGEVHMQAMASRMPLRYPEVGKGLADELAQIPEELADIPGDSSSRGRAATEGSASTDNRLLATGNFSQRATICVSSQVGCAVDCKFCMTALLGLKRNLTPGEITGQVLAVLNDQHVAIDRDRINLVFMGQGEPFLNYDNFMQAVRRLVTDAGIPASRMTVSTSGIIPRIADFAAEEVRPKLAVSLNASNEAQRTEVMPITKKWTIANLLAALRDFPLRNRERLTFEYVLLGGLNDEPRHARELIDLIRGLRAKVNLIALNPGPEIPYAMPDADRVAAFQAILIAAGIPTFLRRPRGRDIYAACGQLKHTTELVQLAGNSE